MEKVIDKWNESDPYEYFMGRWSKLIAPLFLSWLNIPNSLSWLDLGCGTGALSEAIIRNCKPAHLTCIDPSSEFLNKTQERLSNSATFVTGNSSNIPLPNNSVDVLVSGLALNFFHNECFNGNEKSTKIQWNYRCLCLGLCRPNGFLKNFLGDGLRSKCKGT
jgi:trans-aconitate methyltransferase